MTRALSEPWDEASKNLAHELSKRLSRFELSVLVNKPSKDVPDSVNQIPIYSDNWLDNKQKLRLLKLYKYKGQFDLVHFMFTPTKLNMSVLNNLLRKKDTKAIHTVASLGSTLTSFESLKALRSDQLITFSENSKKKLEDIGAQNVVRINPGIDIDKFKPAPKSKNFQKEFGISDDEFVVTYPGEYARLGATDMLVEAIPKLSEAIPNLRFVFACRLKFQSDHDKYDEVREKLGQKDLLSKVTFTHTAEDMPAVYNSSDVVIFPVANMTGKFEVPLSIVEALACSKPVVISDLPEFSDILENTPNPVVPANDLEKTVAAVVDLYKDAEKRKSIGDKSRSFVTANYDIEHVASQYQDVYNQVLNS